MTRLDYSTDELLAHHDYARPLEVAGYRLHGGFDATDAYVPPRTLHRWPAVRAWREQLRARGWPLLDADATLLRTGPYPSFEQQKFLLRHDLAQTFWNSLTITGMIEARGRLLIDLPAPDFQRVIRDDLRETATGHLNKGLLAAHGMDEGGDPRTLLGRTTRCGSPSATSCSARMPIRSPRFPRASHAPRAPVSLPAFRSATSRCSRSS